MSLNIEAFRAAMMKDDAARQNLFKVVIPNKIGKSMKMPSSPGKSKSILGSIVDTVSREVLAKSDVARRISGFYSPEIFRALGLGNMLDKYLQYPYDLGMYVKEINMPGRILGTESFGSDQVVEYSVNSYEFDPMNIQFMCTPSLKERQFFLDWMNIANESGTNKFGYYDEYVANIVIYVYDRQGNAKAVCEISDCVPIRVSDMSMSYEANSQLAIFDVTFRFKNSVTKDYTGGQEGNILTDAKKWYDSAKRLYSTFKN